MRILALERPVANAVAISESIPEEERAALVRAQAARTWELHQAGIVRELHVREDRPEAILSLECTDLAEAEAALATLPLVQAGWMEFELIPLRAYPGFAALFSEIE